MRGWTDLGVVETIYEEEYEDYSSSSTPSLSPPAPLQSRAKKWSLATGLETDVLIHIQGSSFYLHRDPLASWSGYLKRQLTEFSEITLSPPLNITAETFTLVADFCYGNQLVITPFNVAALRTAAELLEMTEANGEEDENLRQKTETYFRRAVAVNREFASIVFRSCLSLLPEVETTASLVSRCIEELSLMEDTDGVISCIDGVKTVRVEDFQIIAESMHHRLTESHDLLYVMVDLYFKDNSGKITDEQKIRVCNYIDCTVLSPQLLVHAVQNPRLPLRFIVQAMFVEQLNTRRSIFSATTTTTTTTNHQPRNKHITRDDAITLGAILQRDAALRQAAQLKVAMDTTASRIQTLERELNSMKKVLRESEIKNHQRHKLESGSGRSASFRFSSENKIERGDRGSASSASFRSIPRREKAGVSFSSEGSCDGTPRVEKNFGRKLMNGLKRAFGGSSALASKQKAENCKGNGDGVRGGDEDAIEDILVIKKLYPFMGDPDLDL
ncbi:BTB/POZ domain-containing protein At3g49900 [Cornus florida]|uniref:BTB/POZ domain-containing protein At3g49900 n=1 Tax=Cornus florida TaxID=4283 RepID=UPI0028967F02|nr:BTB/POZ domain-containing protein At3g49900 [Cornus florida]